jgi:aminoglycoside phosphotransferase (APT) family kinase protein
MNETYRVVLAAVGSVVVRIARQSVPWFTDEAHLMAQARVVGVPTAEVLGVEHVEHDGVLLSFSIQRFLPGRSLDDLAGELPPAELERLVTEGGELLARVHSIVPDRGRRHELQLPEAGSLERGVRIVKRTFGPSAASILERGAEFLNRELAARPSPSPVLAQGDWVPKHLLIDDGAIVGVIDWEFAGPASPAYDFAM